MAAALNFPFLPPPSPPPKKKKKEEKEMGPWKDHATANPSEAVVCGGAMALGETRDGAQAADRGDFSLVKCGRKWGNWGRLIWI